MKNFLIGSIILNLVLIGLLIGQQYQADIVIAELTEEATGKFWNSDYENRVELLNCQQINANATNLLKDRNITIQLK